MVKFSIDMNDYTKSKINLLLRRLAIFSAFILLFSLLPLDKVQAQATSYPYYVVLEGDTFYGIAVRFDCTLDELLNINGMNADSLLRPGDRLKIPSFPGMKGTLTTEYVPLGSSLTSLSRKSQAQASDLIRANKLTSPSELFIGRDIIMTHLDDSPNMATMSSIKQSQSFFEASILAGQNTWKLTEMNRLENPLRGLPMDTYFMPSEIESPSNLAIPGVQEIVIENQPLIQGDTFLVIVRSNQPVNVRAILADIEPVFIDLGNGLQMGYGGIHALQDVGVYPLTMEFSGQDGETYRFDQYVIISSGNYETDPPLTVDPATVDSPEEKAENEMFSQYVSPVTPEQYWDGLWYSPAQDADCITSKFGSRRTYNDNPRVYYHAGLDLGYCRGIDVFAPADGVVVAVLPELIVRGNTIVIDHGMGIHTVYMHLKEFNVSQGERVEKEQLIGLIGSTGRSNGPHLHFEVNVHGTPVNPETWLRRAFP